MSLTEKRTDIPRRDVFISWTSADRQQKNRLVKYLQDHEIEVLESDHDCTGDFRDWSSQAVSRCTVFLLLQTEHTLESKYVPIEVAEFQTREDWENRILPVVSAPALYARQFPKLREAASSIRWDGRDWSDEQLEEILRKIQLLINNRMRAIYREATKPSYLKLRSFLNMVHVRDREFDYDSLYIPRVVTDESGNTIRNAAVFTKSEDIFYLQGPAGSGKSSYIDQLRKAAGEDTLVLTLSCRKLMDTKDIFGAMFEEFSRHCGNRLFYTREDLQSLLTVDHLLLVLDGMDEIATKTGTREFLNAVSDYYEAHAETTTLFFTGRNREDADLISMHGQTPRMLTLCPLEDTQIEIYGKNLFLLLENPEKSDGFYLCIKDLADEIRTNPLLLSQLAIIYDQMGKIPQTTVGIYDAVCEITLSREEHVANVPESYRDMVALRLSGILKAFSAERYRLLTLGKHPATEKILAAVLKSTYADAKERAAFLETYLRDRALIVDGEFYHKMLLEYFTAVYYYEQCFDDYDELEDAQKLKELFSHYDDPYWSAVLQLFLVKADSLIDKETTKALYGSLLSFGITEYTLLFDTCSALEQRETVQCALIRDILEKSLDGSYPPYGPLFWYVPEYSLYGSLLLTLGDWKAEASFSKALALSRDVCWIFGHYSTAREVTAGVDGASLFARASLEGIRYSLCRLFYTGIADPEIEADIHPRCFNPAEALHWKEHGCGIWGRMTTAFEDTLGLYSHEMFSQLGGEYIGIVSAPYDRERLETVLPQSSCKKLCGLFLSATEEREFTPLAINQTHVKAVYVPENLLQAEGLSECSLLDDGLLYFRGSIRLPEGITQISDSAFEGCSALESICIPDSVNTIGFSAFADCTNLKTVTLGASLRVIDGHAFSDCVALEEISIPAGVSYIGQYAFGGCTSLRKITLPAGLSYVSEALFEGCEALIAIDLPYTIREIRDCAFERCSSLKVLALPAGIRKLGYSVFGCCKELTEIVIPAGVTELQECAFERCVSLKSIVIPDGVTTIEERAFADCEALERILLPNSLRRIGSAAFQNCVSLKEIVLPESVEELAGSAFAYCHSLERAVLSSAVKQIGWYTFFGCEALREILLPASLVELADHAFDGCKALQRIVLPEKVIKIGHQAFANCAGLQAFTFPDSVSVVGETVFAGCTALKRLENCPAGYDHTALGLPEDCVISAKEGIRDGVLVVPDEEYAVGAHGLYAGRQNIRKVLVPEGAKAIGAGAFDRCKALEEVSLPEGLTTIRFRAFSGCIALKKIKLPQSATNIEFEAFEGCASLEAIEFPKGTTEIAASLCNCCTALTGVRLPEGVLKIASSAFADCTALEEILLPKSLTTIEGNAFSGCSALQQITIPEDVKLGNGAFSGCVALRSANLPKGITYVPWGVFQNCIGLTEITIPADVGVIEGCAFDGCSGLPSIVVPEGAKTIGTAAFQCCTALRSVVLPESLENLEDSAFKGCAALEAVILPKGIRKIDHGAFAGCAELTEITIPTSVRTLAAGAFGGCTGLRRITLSRRYEDALPEIFSDVDLSHITFCWL